MKQIVEHFASQTEVLNPSPYSIAPTLQQMNKRSKSLLLFIHTEFLINSSEGIFYTLEQDVILGRLLYMVRIICMFGYLFRFRR